MPEVALTPNTLRLVEHVFPPAERAAAVSLLEAECGSGLPFMGDASPEALERVRFAALKLSGGSLAECARAVALAKTDWRDVLVAAGFGNDVRAHEAWLHEQVGA